MNTVPMPIRQKLIKLNKNNVQGNSRMMESGTLIFSPGIQYKGQLLYILFFPFIGSIPDKIPGQPYRESVC